MNIQNEENIPLSESDINALRELDKTLGFSGLRISDIQGKLINKLLDEEKTMIFKLSELDQNFQEIENKLYDVDKQYDDLEKSVEGQIIDYSSIIKDLALYESQNKILDIRMQNLLKLKETLSTLIGESSLSNEEITAVADPKFEDNYSIENCVQTLGKIERFLRGSDKFRQNQYMITKIEDFKNLVNGVNEKLKEHISRLIKQEITSYTHEANNSELNTLLISTKNLRKKFMPLKQIYKILKKIYSSDQNFLVNSLKDVAKNIQSFFYKCMETFEKKWKKELSNFNLFKTKWTITSNLNINYESLNQNSTNTKELTTFFQDFIRDLIEQIEADENFWSKFFSFDEFKLNKDDETMIDILHIMYDTLIQKFISILENTKKFCSISTFFFISEVKNLIDIKANINISNSNTTNTFKKQEKFKVINSFSSIALIEIYNKLNINKNEFAEEQNSALMVYNVSAKMTVILPVKNFTNLAITLYKIFNETNKEVFLSNILFLYECIKAWLFKLTQEKKKEDLILILVNSHHVFSQFSEINDDAYINIASEMNDIFEKHCKSYCNLLFKKCFPQFYEYWSKLKEMGISSNIDAIKLANNYRKEVFLKNVKSNFSKFSSSAEQMLKTIKKHFSKEESIISLQYEKLKDFIIKEYTEISTFARTAYNEILAPSVAEIKEVLIQYRPK